MRALFYEQFQGPVAVREVPDPEPSPDGVVLQVGASGLCRSDWHGWMGHDPDIVVPHVPGHELAGSIVAVGKDVSRWKPGDRVTVPFVGGCGECSQCSSGNHQVCDDQFQPGFTHWGSFAEYVAIAYADTNLVGLPEQVDFQCAASLGCRFATAYRAVIDQGRLSDGQWIAVHGCGGVGLSAIMIARAVGARVIAIDINDSSLERASALGAEACVNARHSADIAGETQELSRGGVHVSIDALGNPAVLHNSVSCLRKRGRHVQVGILSPEHRNARIPTDLIIARELEILGSHGMQAHRYPEMLDMILEGRLSPERLIGQTVNLEQAADLLMKMDSLEQDGITMIHEFS